MPDWMSPPRHTAYTWFFDVTLTSLNRLPDYSWRRHPYQVVRSTSGHPLQHTWRYMEECYSPWLPWWSDTTAVDSYATLMMMLMMMMMRQQWPIFAVSVSIVLMRFTTPQTGMVRRWKGSFVYFCTCIGRTSIWKSPRTIAMLISASKASMIDLHLHKFGNTGVYEAQLLTAGVDQHWG